MTARTKPSANSGELTLFSGSAASETIQQVPRGDDESRHPSADPAAAGSPSLARKMSLLEIDERLCLLMDSAVEAASENDGELPAELQQAVLDYCDAFGEKVDNIARYIRSQEFEAANASAEIDRLKQRMTAAENRCEGLKALLKFFMQSRNVRSMKGRLNTISLRKNSQDSLILSVAAKLPAEFWRVSVVLSGAEWQDVMSYLPPEHALRARLATPEAVEREPHKARLKAFLAGGKTIEGTELRREHHIRLT